MARNAKYWNVVAQGRAKTTITARLSFGNKTVRSYMSNILAKLLVTDRERAAVRGRGVGLGHQCRTGRDTRPVSDPILPGTAGTLAS